MRPSGRSRITLALALAAALGACLPYGFAGGGLPADIRTVAVMPFENETPQPDLQREVWETLRSELKSRLGLRDAPEARADAVVRGTILRYDTGIPIAYTANSRQQVSSARRKLQIVCDIEIVNQKTGKTLWQRKSLTAEGDYDEPGEAKGRVEALKKLVTDVVEGAQSQW